MKKALLLIDIQNDYFPNGKMELHKAEQASENAQEIVAFFRKEKQSVIHIQHHSTRADATFFIPETEGVKIHKNVTPKQDETVVIKNFPNSFRATELLEILKQKGIEQLVICGMMTHMCVDATVRAAKDFGFECIVIGDACATKDLEIKGQTVKATEVQKAFLAGLNYFYADVQNTEEYLIKMQSKC